MNTAHSGHVDITSAVTDWLKTLLRGTEITELKLLEKQDNPSSVHWIFGSGGTEQKPKYFVKMHAARNLYIQERDALEVLSGYCDVSEPFAVPEMLGSNDELNCIVLRWLNGDSIASSIRQSVSRFAAAEDILCGTIIARNVGRWLSNLKDRTSEPHTSLPSDGMQSRFDELIGIIEFHAPNLLDPITADRLKHTFAQLLTESRWAEDCLVHNDFWFEHIWESQERIIVLDFGRARIGPSGRDAIQFYNRLCDIAILNPLISREYCDRIVRAFCEGYGGLDVNSDKNRMWQLSTRAEQLAGLAEFSTNNPRLWVSRKVYLRALGRQLANVVN